MTGAHWYTAFLFPFAAWVLGAIGPCILLASRDFYAQVLIIAAVAGAWEVIIRVLPAQERWTIILKLLLLASVPWFTWQAVGRAPAIVAMLAVLAADLALMEGSVGWTMPRKRGRVTSLALLAIAVAQICWIRFEWLALSVPLLLVSLGILLAYERHPAEVSRVDRAWRRGLKVVADALAMAILFVVSTLVLYLPGVLGRVLDAVRRRSDRPTYWRHREISIREARRDSPWPFASTPRQVRVRRLGLGALGAILIGAIIIVAFTVPQRSGESQEVAGARDSRQQGTQNPFERAREIKFSELASYSGIPFADQLKAEQDRFSNHFLQPSPVGGYDIAAFDGRFTNVSDGERLTLEPRPCACPRRTVWVAGASAAFGLGQRDLHTIASELVRIARDAGVMLEVHNLGVPGWTLYQERQKVMNWIGTRQRPDLVIFYDGFNDIIGAIVDAALHGTSESGTNLLRSGDLAALTANGIDPSDLLDAAEVGRVAAERYAEQQRIITGALNDVGVESLFVFQPDAFASDEQFETVADIYQMNSAQRAFVGDALEAASETLEPGVINLRHLFDDEPSPVFADLVHTNEVGAALAAERLYPLVRQALDIG